jgi:7-carboxy-7-deazaguanine synthase
MLRTLTIPVHESFQQTVQGEGYWTGTPVDFIRLSGCPIGCHWCDTGYSDGGRELPRSGRTIDELVAELKSPRVVISGGEPFIHKQLPDLIAAIERTGRQVSIETSGAFWLDVPASTWITLSPKEHVSKYPVHPLFWKRADEIKIVISTGDELDFYKDHISHKKSLCQVFLQPEWNQRETAIPKILELLKFHPTYRLSLQTHKFIGVR